MQKMVVAAVVAALVVPGVASAAEPESTVTWGACPANVAPLGLECGTVKVPLDHAKPKGQKIEISISRLASKKPEKRRGVLLTNPGGPGGEGMTFPFALKALGLPQDVQDAYDVIGIDPRGVGNSTPVTCDLTQEQKLKGNVPPYAVTQADVTKWAEESRKIANQCATSRTAWMLPHVSTANAARDMDQIRQALKEPKASFLGYSYGTHLGAVYATLFPNRTDRVVLDSSLPAKGWDVEGGRGFGRGVEDRFPDFAKWVAARPEYGLGTTPQQVRDKFFDLAARLDQKPVPGIDGPMFRFLTFAFIYGDRTFPTLAEYWQALDTGKPLPEEEPAPDPDNAISSRLYTVCNDSRWPTSVSTYQRNVAIDRVRYPMFGAAAANIQPCAFWPDPEERPISVGDRGPANVMIAQNDRDPATPLTGAQDMRRALGKRAVMVSADQGGHGAYVLAPNKCLNGAVTSFLLDGKRPAHDLRCAAE
ncbi:alpha/beta hydrolase [Lentzea sp. PSKA42]|uniref:Alpha/beta hydrolase n=1 Tax=Lentzea indica TaxID=2604800 RepID=A0ABX1FKV8_9PSEU|nr:alpha/beta hydrolase [Lentzea indica]NKE59618.1 alpha/beta hydrolase [Lentzea indica]